MCPRCSRLKLWKHDRRLLLEAGEPGRPLALVLPLEPGPSAAVMTRRAVAKLAAAGLITVTDHPHRAEPAVVREALRRSGRLPTDGRERTRIEYYLADPVWPSLDKKWVRPRWMTRTRLGHAVVQEYEPLLREPGRPIRWDARLDRAMEAARLVCGQCG